MSTLLPYHLKDTRAAGKYFSQISAARKHGPAQTLEWDGGSCPEKWSRGQWSPQPAGPGVWSPRPAGPWVVAELAREPDRSLGGPGMRPGPGPVPEPGGWAGAGAGAGGVGRGELAGPAN